MIEDWEVKKLGDVCDYQNGFAFKSKTYKESGTPVIRITNIQNERLDLSKIVHINRDDYDKDLRRYEIVEGDLLIAMSGATTGKIGLVETDDIFLLNQRVGKFEPKEDLDKRYLFYYLTNKVEESLAISAGSAQPNLSTTQIKGFKIPLPPLQEQKRIVAILDDAFAALDRAKANIEQNIENAEELFQSKLNAIFSQQGEGWEEKILKEISKIMYGHTAKSSADFQGPKYLRITDIQDNNVDWNSAPSCPPLENDLEKYQLHYGDIVFARTGATTGKSYLVFDPPEAVFASYLIRVQADLELLKPDFLYLYFQSPKYWKIINRGISGSAQGGFNATKLGKLRIPVPPTDVQDQIVDEVNNIHEVYDKLRSLYAKKLTNIEDLKKSILQQAFSGQLTGEGDHRVVAGSSS